MLKFTLILPFIDKNVCQSRKVLTFPVPNLLTDILIMKNLTSFIGLLAICSISLTSCSKDSIEEFDVDSADLKTEIAPVEYTSMEVNILELVNDYRSQQGLPGLVALDESSVQAAGHNDHMIETKEVCHENFARRYQALVSSVQAKAVSENVAYGYRTAEAVVAAWIKSDSHRENMLGNHTHFGISVREGQDGNFYFTNIFLRK